MSKNTKKRQVQKRKKLLGEFHHLVSQKPYLKPEFHGIHNPFVKNGVCYVSIGHKGIGYDSRECLTIREFIDRFK